MKRRQFIGLSAYLAAAIALPVFESCSGDNTDAILAEPDTLIRILDKKNIIGAGQDYLKKFPEENDRQKLVGLLTGHDSSPSTSKQTIHSRLNRQCASDFAQDNTVVVNGWVLCRTEARQCALFTLLQS